MDSCAMEELLREGEGMIGAVPLNSITAEVCQQYDCTLSDIRRWDRSPRYVTARIELCYRLRLTGLYSYPKIGQHICRDPTSVRNAVIKLMQPADFALPWMPRSNATRYAGTNISEADKDFV